MKQFFLYFSIVLISFISISLYFSYDEKNHMTNEPLLSFDQSDQEKIETGGMPVLVPVPVSVSGKAEIKDISANDEHIGKTTKENIEIIQHHALNEKNKNNLLDMVTQYEEINLDQEERQLHRQSMQTLISKYNDQILVDALDKMKP